MATFPLVDATIWLNDLNLGGISNVVNLTRTVDELTVPVFGDSAQRRIAGPQDADFEAGGWWDLAGDYDTDQFDEIGSPDTTPILTISPTATEGDTAFVTQHRSFTHTFGGRYGQAAEASLGGKANGSVYRGGVTLASQVITGNTNGTGVQFAGGVAATETVAAAVHVFVDNGTSLDVIIESDDNAGFTSATTRSTIAVSGTTYTYFDTVAGAITDDYWRARTANVVGTSFTLGVSIGIA